MKFASVVIVAAALFARDAAPRPPQGAQTSSSASGSAAVQTDHSGAQASTNPSTSASAGAGQDSAKLSSGTAVNAVLTHPVDAKKNKPGDEVAAKTTQTVKSDGRAILPKGAKLIGHVTECKARDKQEKESAIGIVFDRAILRNGEEIPLNVTIAAVAAAEGAASASSEADDFGAGAGTGAMGSTRGSAGGALGGVRGTAGAATGAVSNTAANAGGIAGGALGSTANAAGAARGAVGGLNAAGQLTSDSRGVFGLNGLSLSSAASASAQGSLITSTSRNVHLDSGTQFLLVAQGSAQATKH